MIKVSKLADYAVVILASMAEDQGAVMSASALADLTRVPEPTVSKILKLLVQADIVSSMRGIHGGYALSKPNHNITVEQIIRAIDGPISITACADSETPDCGLVGSCSLRGRWDGVNMAIRSALETVTLADMVGNKMNKEGQKRYGGY